MVRSLVEGMRAKEEKKVEELPGVPAQKYQLRYGGQVYAFRDDRRAAMLEKILMLLIL